MKSLPSDYIPKKKIQGSHKKESSHYKFLTYKVSSFFYRERESFLATWREIVIYCVVSLLFGYPVK